MEIFLLKGNIPKKVINVFGIPVLRGHHQIDQIEHWAYGNPIEHCPGISCPISGYSVPHLPITGVTEGFSGQM